MYLFDPLFSKIVYWVPNSSLIIIFSQHFGDIISHLLTDFTAARVFCHCPFVGNVVLWLLSKSTLVLMDFPFNIFGIGFNIYLEDLCFSLFLTIFSHYLFKYSVSSISLFLNLIFFLHIS